MATGTRGLVLGRPVPTTISRSYIEALRLDGLNPELVAALDRPGFVDEER